MIHRPWDQWQWNGRVHTPFCPPRKANLLKDLWNFLSFFPGSHNTCWHRMTWCPPPHFTESVPLKTTSKLLVVKPSANPSIIFLPDLPATFFTNPLLLYLHGPRLFWPPLSPTVGFFSPVSAGLPITLTLYNLAGPSPQPRGQAVSVAVLQEGWPFATSLNKTFSLNIYLKAKLEWPTQKSQKLYSRSDNLFRKQIINYMLVLKDFTSSPQLTS